jgi:hypothetical protein
MYTPVNDFKEQLTLSDALVYIHPDMARSSQVKGNRNYLNNIKYANIIMGEIQKPIFFLPWSEEYYHYISPKVTSSWSKIPSRDSKLSRLSSEDLQAHIDYMAHKIGKTPEEIILAGGGMALGACVTDFMTCWCDKLKGPYSSFAVNKPIEKKLGKGIIIPELTDISSLLLE